jgi:hypothetical protein
MKEDGAVPHVRASLFVPLFVRRQASSDTDDFSTFRFMVSFERRIVMPPAKLIVAVAAAILFAQVQCAAACAADACASRTTSVPPCHKHHDHSHDQNPASCSFHLIITPAMQPHAPQLDIPAPSVLGLAATISLVLPVDTQSWALALSEPSPPGIPGISSTVLRV